MSTRRARIRFANISPFLEQKTCLLSSILVQFFKSLFTKYRSRPWSHYTCTHNINWANTQLRSFSVNNQQLNQTVDLDLFHTGMIQKWIRMEAKQTPQILACVILPQGLNSRLHVTFSDGHQLFNYDHGVEYGGFKYTQNQIPLRQKYIETWNDIIIIKI